MDKDVVKPPWHTIEFQSSPFFETAMIEKFLRVPFDLSWNEMPHTELTEMKEKIAPLESNHKWELLKKKSNPYELVYTQETSECPASVTILKPLSRSYFKMIEMLQVSQFFERLPKGTHRLRSSHVAEGPGGFIEAFLDRAESNRLTVQKSYAITLKPNSNHVPGWRRSYQFLQRHPEVKIHYGVDGTGDIYVPENQTSFVHLHDTVKSLLFTGDGGFDFSTDYENQEKSVYPLLVSSALIGIQVLAPEGTLVLKLFDTYTSVTQFFIRCVSLCFREWCLYKPATSRPCNSERYLICRGFRKAYPHVMSMLMTLQTRWRQFQNVPQVEFFNFFSEQEKAYLEAHIQQFSRTQMENLQKTIDLQTIPPSEYQWKEQYANATRWCLDFHVPVQKPKV
jgi:23S rRNA U2552 (ribose-2'-O)-methylase RlmE/FtsJ